MLRILATAAVIAALSGGAFSVQAQTKQSGSAAEREACTPDVYKICEAAIPDEKRIVECLKKNRKLLSKACERVLFDDAK